MATFLGVLNRSTGPLQNIGSADVWVAHEHTPYVGMLRGLGERDLARVRSVPGVAWAEPLLSYETTVDLPDGNFFEIHVMGIDRATLVGRPPEMVVGDLDDLRQPDAVFLDSGSGRYLPGVGVGDVLRLNDRRARVVGICRAEKGIFSKPLLYTTAENAMRFVPLGRERISFILVKTRDGAGVRQVCDDIEALPNLAAFPADELRWRTMKFIMLRTCIGLNFAVTVLLGLGVGLVVSTAAFNQFTADHLAHFALLKAVGARPRALVRLVLLQGLTAGLVSYGVGVGLAALLALPGLGRDAELAACFPWQLLVGGLVPMLLCVSVGGLLSLRRVLKVDPVTLFQ
jgi:putative ABC transport system permease protein